MMDNPEHSEPATIGIDIPWEAIVGEACRVKNFMPLARVEAGKIKDTMSALPYGTLLVESPKLPKEAYLHVVHKDDFRTLWEVFRERSVGCEEEVIVFYVPFYKEGLKTLLSAVMPRLHVYIYPKGHLEEIYDPNSTVDQFFRKPIAQYEPKYWKP